MRYFGGKARIAKPISEYLQSIRKPNQTYIEPFVGAAWVMSLMDGNRKAFDKHPYLISMYQMLQKGWMPPSKISEEEYIHIKNNQDEIPHLAGFVGFGCSFSGKWFGCYARSKDRNYCSNAYNSVLKKMKTLQDVEFNNSDYRDLCFKDSLIYCDPPYQGTTQYGKVVGEFDTAEFWEIMRDWSMNNTVVISEYQAPDDFICVWEKQTNTDIRNKNNIKEQRIEKLFTYIN